MKCPTGRIEVVWNRDDDLPDSIKVLSREVEGRFKRNGGHEFGAKSGRNGGRSGAAGTP
jgi:hypothetical protein